jgi:hypothetical protein
LTDSLYLEDFARAYNQGLDDILDDVSAKRFPE